MKNKPKSALSPEAKLDKILDLLQRSVVIQLYRGGAKQQEIADSFNMAIGKVNKLLAGVKPPKEN